MSKNSFLVIFLLISFQISSNDVSIEIDISEQRLYLIEGLDIQASYAVSTSCLLYTSPSPRDYGESRMPSSA